LVQALLQRGLRLGGSKVESEEIRIDPELEKKLVDTEIRKAMDPDFKLREAAKNLAASRMEHEARAYRREGEMEEEREEVEKVEERKEEKKERRFSVVNGQVFLDEEGDFTLKEAIMVAATQRQQVKGYILKPDGTKEEVEGTPVPVIMEKKTPSEIYFIDQEGNLKQMKSGEPIVIPRQEPKSYVVMPDGTIEEREPGKPIVIKIEKERDRSPLPPVFEVRDKDGNPIAMDFSTMMKWLEFQDKRKYEEEKHEGLKGLVQAVREELIPRVGQVMDRVWGSERGMNPVECEDCGLKFEVPKELPVDKIVCPNPNCPSHEA